MSKQPTPALEEAFLDMPAMIMIVRQLFDEIEEPRSQLLGWHDLDDGDEAGRVAAARGLRDVQYVVSDAHDGLRNAIAKVLLRAFSAQRVRQAGSEGDGGFGLSGGSEAALGLPGRQGGSGGAATMD